MTPCFIWALQEKNHNDNGQVRNLQHDLSPPEWMAMKRGADGENITKKLKQQRCCIGNDIS